jgi:hypothetical protein
LRASAYLRCSTLRSVALRMALVSESGDLRISRAESTTGKP